MSQSQDNKHKPAEIDTAGGAYVDRDVYTRGGDFVGRDKHIHGDEVQSNQITIGSIITNLFGNTSDDVRRLRNRQAMLKLVRDIWVRGVLGHSLFNQVAIDLDMEMRPQAVNRPWDAVPHVAKRVTHRLLQGAKIASVFAEMNHSLLILGEPGSGKTILLLELAEAAITQAEQDVTHPIPVVFNLASWGAKRQSMAAWLVDELKSKYNIPQKVAQAWVDQDELLLLLDGLDEVRLEQRASCVEALNRFQQERTSLISLVVCCRTADYMALPVQLKLQSAVVLQPLTLQQIEAYLKRVEGNLSSVSQALQHDSSLQELAQSPLLLSTMLLAYRSRPVEELLSLGSDHTRRQRLFDTYVQQMSERGRRKQAYPQKRTMHWLTWLARQMIEHNQAIFLIEQLQPSWLPTPAWRWFYLLASRAVGGALAGILVWLVVFIGESDLPGFDVAFLHRFPPQLQAPLPYDGAVALIILNMGIGLVVGIVDGLFFEYRQRGVEAIHLRHWQISLHPLIVGVVVMVLATTVLLFFDEPIQALFVGLLASISFVLGFGYLEHVQNLDTEIRTVEALSWSWREAAKGILPGLILGVLTGGVMGLLYGISHGFIFLITFTLFFILLGGLRRNQIDEKQHPNQGIHLSMTNSLWAAFLFGLVFMSVYATRVLHLGLAKAWPRSALFVLVAWLLYGGSVLMKHGAVRIVLWLNGYLPWNYAALLDDCADHIFLRKVGGGYIFIHRLLMEHFAAMTEEDIKRLTQPARQDSI